MLYAVLMPFRIECVEESLKRMPEVLMAQRDFVFLKTPLARAGCATAQCESCSTLWRRPPVTDEPCRRRSLSLCSARGVGTTQKRPNVRRAAEWAQQETKCLP
jgi:hypothetical protein